MRATFQLEEGAAALVIDPSSPRSIAIALRFDGPQPRAFGLSAAQAAPLVAGDFVTEVKRGGPVNCLQLTCWPHANGTHTESIGHVLEEPPPIGALEQCFALASLISITPEPLGTSQESYPEPCAPEDQVLTARAIKDALEALGEAPGTLRALVIRTLPNSEAKLTRDYSEQNPPYLTREAMALIASLPLHHLLLDLPSVDREHDAGQLSNHRSFWHLPPGATHLPSPAPDQARRTITEMIFAPDALRDAHYLLELQLPPFMCDAAPSRPRLYDLIKPF